MCFLYLIKEISQIHTGVSLCMALHKLLGKEQNTDNLHCGRSRSWGCVLGKSVPLCSLTWPIDSKCVNVMAKTQSCFSVSISMAQGFTPHSQGFAHGASCSGRGPNTEAKQAVMPEVWTLSKRWGQRCVFCGMQCFLG